MVSNVLSYITEKRVGVLAIEMLDGAPHAATVHYAHRADRLTFIFETHRDYRKCEPLFGRAESRASFVVGFEEGAASKTLQLDGIVCLLDESDAELRRIYLEKFPEKEAKASDEKAVFFSFTPTWWRFTDWSAPGGKTIFNSDGTVG